MHPSRALLLSFALVALSLSAMLWATEQGSSYKPHGIIVIPSNSGFIPANGVTQGSGTPSDPYVIEGWDIDASGVDVGGGIWISNTTAHFIVRNNYIHDINWGYPPCHGQCGAGIIIEEGP